MTELNVKTIAEVLPYDGPRTIPGIRFRSVGRALGVSSWGMNVLEIDAGCTGHPQHDHARDQQEEVYVVLEGDGTLETIEGQTPLARGTLARVGPSAWRKIVPGPNGITVLALGGIPGKAYPAK